jgi:hypothetical protein
MVTQEDIDFIRQEMLEEAKEKEQYELISKELLSEVLHEEVTQTGTIMEHNQALQYSTESQVHYSLNKHINVFELAHLCKEWARSEGLEMFIYELKDSQKNYEVRVLRKGERDSEEYIFSWWNLATEPEAVIKACQWILDNKDT